MKSRPWQLLLLMGCVCVLVRAQLVENCFGWPGQAFTPSNHAQVTAGLPVGSPMVDFTLPHVNGTAFKLSELLAQKPVLLQLGSYTCPVFEGNIAGSLALSSQYSAQVHFVVVYTIEAHPKSDPSPFKGTPWEFQYSNYTQPRTFAGRETVANALLTSRGFPENSNLGAQLLLVDQLGGTGAGAKNNGVWCTYGPAANAGFLLAQNGTVLVSEPWINLSQMEAAIQGLVGHA